jgi:hypothetical protein
MLGSDEQRASPRAQANRRMTGVGAKILPVFAR